MHPSGLRRGRGAGDHQLQPATTASTPSRTARCRAGPRRRRSRRSRSPSTATRSSRLDRPARRPCPPLDWWDGARPLSPRGHSARAARRRSRRRFEVPQPALRAAGIGVPITDRSDLMRRLLGPLGWRAESGFSQRVDVERIRRIQSAFRRTPGDRALPLVSRIWPTPVPSRSACCARCWTRWSSTSGPIVSGRSWARQIPSDYQQLVQAGLTVSYDDFLEQVRTRSGTAGERFWRRQSPSGGRRELRVPSPPTERWMSCACRRHGEDPRALYRLFAEIVRLLGAPTSPSRAGSINASFGVVEVELLRRVNALLRDRLPSIRRRLPPCQSGDPCSGRGSLKRSASARLELPFEALGWVRARGEHDVAALRAGATPAARRSQACCVATDGDGGEVPVAGDAELAGAAVEAPVAAAGPRRPATSARRSPPRSPA